MAAEMLPPEADAIRGEALAVVATAETMTVTCQPEFEALGAYLTGSIIPARKRVADFFAPMKEAAHKAHRAICARETEILAPIDAAEKKAKKALGDYAAEQERQRRAAEAEAARLAREEQDRLAAERAAQAEELADAGETEAAVELLDAPPPLAFVQPDHVEAPKAAGVAVRKSWVFRIVDPAKVNRAFLTVDEKKVAALVRAIGPDAAAQVGGIVVEEEFRVAGRGR